MPDKVPTCWRVVHCFANVESVYLVTATNEREARNLVKYGVDFGPEHPDHCRDCTWSMQPFRPEPPYFLYAINRSTGEMSPSDSQGGASMCLTCLGTVPGS